MKIICVDDHPILLSQMLEYVREAIPDATVFGFNRQDCALTHARHSGCDVLLTEIELYGRPSGLELARNLQKLNPRLNVIFTTVCSPTEYAREVMEIRPSGYITKVVSKEEVNRALSTLLYN